MDRFLFLWGETALVVAALASTTFFLLYLFFPWYNSLVGRAMILKALGMALALDITVWFHFFPPNGDNITGALVVQAVVFTIIMLGALGLVHMLWRENFTQINDKKEVLPLTHRAVEESGAPTPILKNRTYDAVKFVALVLLPALGSLYFGLSQIWGFPNGEQVVGTVVLLETFLGALVGISKKTYDQSDMKYDGQINVVDTPEKLTYDIELGMNPEDLRYKNEVTLKISGPNSER